MAHGFASLDVSDVAEWTPATTTTLANQGDVVVQGTLESWLPGESVSSAEGMFFWSTIVAKIRVDKVLTSRQGVVMPESEHFYVRTVVGTEDMKSLVDTLPRGMAVLAYLYDPQTRPMVPREDNDAASNAPQAVHTPGDAEVAANKLWMFTSPQGFAVQDGDQVRWPFIGAAAPGSVEEAGPSDRLDGLTDEQRAQAEVHRAQLAREGIDVDRMFDPENFPPK
ncbi:MAG: hypothetical protein JST33_04340 [Actinobacteria bacterium]|nr:hypothetical protein [Actinomycetota bacterium]